MQKLLITSRGVKISQNAIEYIQKKIEKVSKMLKRSVTFHCEIIRSKHKIGLTKNIQIEVTFHLPKTFIKVEKEGSNVFEAIDKVEPLLLRIIDKHKGKILKRNKREKFSEVMFWKNLKY